MSGFTVALSLAATAPAQEPLFVLTSPPGAVGFGKRVTALGDVDADGLPDAAVADGQGGVHVLTGPQLDVHWTLAVRQHVAGLASVDTDGDGVRELVIASQSALANAELVIEAYDVASRQLVWQYYDFQFAGEDEVRFAVLGDATGDGIDDLLVGMPSQTPWHPASWLSSCKILSGATGHLRGELLQDPAGMGEGVATVGDVDHDGRPDFAIGSRSRRTATVSDSRGSVFLVTGGTGAFGPIRWSVDGSHPEAELGEDVVAIGDRDGDGVNDLAALESLPPVGGARALRVHALSSATGAFLAHRDFPGEAFPGALHEPELEPTGDVDGDGVRDFVLAVPRSGAHGGAEVRVLSGATLATLHAWSVTLSDGLATPGPTSAAELGDLDLDGSSELIVGRPDGGAGGRVFVLPTRRSVGLDTCAAAVANSTGRVADLRLAGSLAVALNSLRFIGNDLPASAWVLPIAGDAGASVPMAGGSTGTLCVGGNVRRLGDSVARADAGGAFFRPLDLATWNPAPGGSAPTPALPGETWHFQLWFRDFGAGSATSNFSDAVRATFE
jgi:hypothetical protein